MSKNVEMKITETEDAPQNMEAAPVVKKSTKKAAPTATERAREQVKIKLAAAGRPNKADMLSRLAHDN